jgi:hypothetical protein
MSLKPPGVRGSLRNVSVGTLAIPDSVVDHFEEVLYEDQSLTLSDKYGGDTGSFQRQTSTVNQGTYALEITSGGVINDADPNQTIAEDTEYRFDILTTDGTSWPILHLMVSTENNSTQGYGIQLRPSENDARLVEFSSGFNALATTGSGSLSASAWYRCFFEKQSDDTINFGILSDDNNNKLTGSYTDSSDLFSSGGVGMSINGSSTGYWDDIGSV